MQIILADIHRTRLLPLTFTRPVAHLTVGIDRLMDKWERKTDSPIGVLTATYLEFPRPNNEDVLLVNAALIPDEKLVSHVEKLEKNSVLTFGDHFLAAVCSPDVVAEVQDRIDSYRRLTPDDFPGRITSYAESVDIIEAPSDIFSLNDSVLRRDFRELTAEKEFSSPDGDIKIKGNELYISDSAIINTCTLNTETGPIYIGKNAEIMEGAMIRGPFSLGDHSAVKMGAKIYGATTVGVHCKIGGEVNNSVIGDYSNKGHDGFLGNSVIGSWCNLGADTNTSNLKNNYGNVRVYNYESGTSEDTGRQFHGLIMGDHSKAGINTMFNTGTVVGVCANIFGGGFPPKFIPSFSWGSPEAGFTPFRFEKAVEAATAMMKRRSIDFTARDERIFRHIENRESQGA